MMSGSRFQRTLEESSPAASRDRYLRPRNRKTNGTVRGNGKGGRNQELALAAAVKISGSEGVVVGSFATDGIEGRTNAAGALADGSTITRSLRLRMDPDECLRNNDSYQYFSK